MKLLTILITIIFLSSCNINKKLDKSKSEIKTDTEIKTVNTTTTTETALEPLKIAADSLKGTSTNLILDPIIEEDPDIELKITQDPITKVITAKAVKKAKTIDIPINRTIITKNEENKTIKETQKIQTKALVKDISGGLNLNYIWWIVALIVIIILAILIYRFRFIIFKRNNNDK